VGSCANAIQLPDAGRSLQLEPECTDAPLPPLTDLHLPTMFDACRQEGMDEPAVFECFEHRLPPGRKSRCRSTTSKASRRCHCGPRGGARSTLPLGSPRFAMQHGPILRAARAGH